MKLWDLIDLAVHGQMRWSFVNTLPEQAREEASGDNGKLNQGLKDMHGLFLYSVHQDYES